MTLEWIIDHVWALFVAIGGWWVNNVQTKHDKLQEKVYKIEADLPKDYVAIARFESLADTLQNTLNRIEDKLDRKVDK